ncbi:MDR family MFS transporter [Actinosynnema mirum]|uniref:Drug resistance transporter, EmrB/QacA subfamily n=1 Tax=Actinosynnema mirum (strain ATCC 29888 / DSM 43827 / JCM 3225 / NBRC 14064 / NCIMB 13271 / NRRL B-12336 / IMRU 3971 / 101) TaxID=446462 RepID=C6WNY4_ACTMD|nr:MDR family MFS transporter [Actinosynnema mirum]ACU36653.1 drug resistance transporter, EmrB/QacA subfamily [Actinosynnema mirum DSM 43827]
MTAPGSRIDRPLLRTAFVLVLGTFMATLDATIVAVGVDRLSEDFGAGVTEVQWVTTAYLLAVVASVPASGWLADRFGGRRVWLGALGVFLLGSALCAVAWSLPSLVAFRVVQGIGGGLLPPTGQALLARVAGPGRIGRLISVVGVVPLLSPVLGPLTGGTLLAVADWPWLFLVNLPIGVVAAALAVRHVPSVPPSEARARFDLVGALLLAPGLAVLVLGLTGDGGPPVSAAGIGLGVLALVAFTWHGLRARDVPPLVDPRLFTRPPFGVAALALLLLGASVFGTMFLLPLYLQGGGGLTPWRTGLLLAPQGIGAAAGSVLVSRLVDRTAPRVLVLCGIGLVALGTVPFTQLHHAPPDALVAGALLLRGVGAALVSAPVLATVYRSLPPGGLPRAAGALNLLNTVGGSLGTALLAVLLGGRLAARGPDVAAAYADTFWWVLALVLVAAAGATRLPASPPVSPKDPKDD